MPSDPLPAEIVRAYDIRGTTPDQIDESVSRRLGSAFGRWLNRRGAQSVAVGCDARRSSPALYESAIDGLTASGLDAYAVGVVPTPVVGWTVDREGLGGGLVITASHNPPEFNGFKLLADEATPLLPDEIQEVAHTEARTTNATGRRREIDATTPYLELLGQRFANVSGGSVAIDPGYGAAAVTAPQAMLATGARVHAIRASARPTGGLAADPQNPETLRELARVTRTVPAELGIAWDGDGDRIGVLDHLGRRYEADWLVAVLARALLADRPGSDVLLDLKTSSSVVEDITRHGGRPLTARTGYSFFRRMMREQGIAFGGETSGHIMFGPGYRQGEHAPWIDDGVYAACALLAWLAKSDNSLSEAMATIEPRPISPELRLPCPDDSKAAVAAAIGDWFAQRHPDAPIDRSDGARVVLEHGWLHARASNTAPALSLRFEANTEAQYRQLAEMAQAAVGLHRQVGGLDQLANPPILGPQPLI